MNVVDSSGWIEFFLAGANGPTFKPVIEQRAVGKPCQQIMKGRVSGRFCELRHCSEADGPKVFLLWGAHAQKKEPLIDSRRHQVLSANHPSPLSARRGPVPFVGCGHFGLANRWLAGQGLPPVLW